MSVSAEPTVSRTGASGPALVPDALGVRPARGRRAGRASRSRRGRRGPGSSTAAAPATPAAPRRRRPARCGRCRAGRRSPCRRDGRSRAGGRRAGRGVDAEPGHDGPDQQRHGDEAEEHGQRRAAEEPGDTLSGMAAGLRAVDHRVARAVRDRSCERAARPAQGPAPLPRGGLHRISTLAREECRTYPVRIVKLAQVGCGPTGAGPDEGAACITGGTSWAAGISGRTASAGAPTASSRRTSP